MEAIHAIILTFNEEKHIERCISSVVGLCDSVLVVDSGSSDATIEIARRLGASVLHNRFVNHAAQLNFAIGALSGRGGWLLRIDADEILSTPPADIRAALAAAPAEVLGLLVRRRIHFLGRPMIWGGMDPIWHLRMWREGKGQCEQRWMDEHVIVDGPVIRTEIMIEDVNLNPLSWWVEKHNGYASREAIEVLFSRHKFREASGATASLSGQAATKRLLKEKLYLKLPVILRGVCYFLYRYFLRLGFLDGKAGWYFHLFQGLWYRTLVDAKVAEIESYAQEHSICVLDAVRTITGIEPHEAQT